MTLPDSRMRRPKNVADPVIALVADDRRAPDHRQYARTAAARTRRSSRRARRRSRPRTAGNRPAGNGRRTTPVSMKTMRKMKRGSGRRPSRSSWRSRYGVLDEVDEEIDDIHGSLCVFLRGCAGSVRVACFPSCATNVPLRTNHRLPTVYAVCAAVRRRVANLHKSSICAYGRVLVGGVRPVVPGGCSMVVRQLSSVLSGCPVRPARPRPRGARRRSWPELVVLRRSSDGARVASHLILAIRWRKTSHDFDFWRLFSSRATPNTP